MKLEDIETIADFYRGILTPATKRVEKAGSIRRRKPECGDIELVIIRDMDKIEELKQIVNQWKKIKGEITGRYTQRLLGNDLKLDIFIAADDGSNWGNIYLIRTGNWKFSRFMMGIKAKQCGYIHRDGYLWKNGKRIDCYIEEEIFSRFGMDFVEPEDRSWE